MATKTFAPLKGHCACKKVTYEVLAPFLSNKCCHCTWCQRETGSAFAINCLIETSNFRVTSETKPIFNDIPTASGDGQTIARCPNCYVVLYSDYDGDGSWWLLVKAGTLDDKSKQSAKPDVHIYTSTKLDWVDLTSEKERGIPIAEEAYPRRKFWKQDAMDRFDIVLQKFKEAKKAEEEAGKTKT